MIKLIKSLFKRKCDHALMYGIILNKNTGLIELKEEFFVHKQGSFGYDLKNNKIIHQTQCLICCEDLYIDFDRYKEIDKKFIKLIDSFNRLTGCALTNQGVNKADKELAEKEIDKKWNTERFYLAQIEIQEREI